MDASALGAVVLPDEESPASAIMREILTRSAIQAPAHWPAEVANMLLMAIRRGRLETAQMSETFAATSIVVTGAVLHSPLETGLLVDLAATHKLTAYDAAYLDVALRLRCPLATVDNALRRAARSLDVELIVP